MRNKLVAFLLSAFIAFPVAAQDTKPSCAPARETLRLTEEKLVELEKVFKETKSEPEKYVVGTQGNALFQLRAQVQDFIRLNCSVVNDGR